MSRFTTNRIPNRHPKVKDSANPRLEAAISYLRRGWSVIPLCWPDEQHQCGCGRGHKGKEIGKAPLIPWSEFQHRLPTEEEVREWWARWPKANIGIVTGQVSEIIVVDVDTEDEGRPTRRNGFPVTPLAATGRGKHYYLKHPGGVVRNFARRLPGTDLRADGGYVVAPPSVHRSGRIYGWVINPEQEEPAECPKWLLGVLEREEGKDTGEGEQKHLVPKEALPERFEKLLKADKLIQQLWSGKGKVKGDMSRSGYDISLLYQCYQKGITDPTDLATILVHRPGSPVNERHDPQYYIDSTVESVLKKVAKGRGAKQKREGVHEDSAVEKDGKKKLSNSEIATLFLRKLFIKQGEITLHYWREDFYEWTRTHYMPIPPKDMRARIAHFIENFTNREVTQARISNILEILRGRLLLPALVEAPVWTEPGEHGYEVTPASGIIAMENGLLDLEGYLETAEASLQAHSPKFFNLNALPYPFDPKANCPTWTEFLDHNLESDEKRIRVLQEFAGYCLLPDTSYHKFLLMEGEGANGKSVFTKVITAMLGEQNVSHVPLEAFGQRFALAPTLGKLANIASEVGELDRVAEGHLKEFVAGDRMEFDRKYHHPVEARPTARLILATNSRPRFTDRSEGLWRRMLLIPWRIQIPPEQQDRHLADTIIEKELPGVFTWAVMGLARIRAQGGFTHAEIVEEAIKEYRQESNPARTFLKEHYEEDPNGRVPCSDVYQGYHEWCGENGYSPLNERNFGKEVRRTFSGASRIRSTENGKRPWVYKGIKPAYENTGW